MLLVRMKRGLDGCVDACAMVLMAALASVVFIAVITRYFLNLPLAWSEEVSRYCFLWLSFLGAEVCLRRSGHVSVDLVVKVLPMHCRRWLDACGRLLMAVMLVAILLGGIKVAVVAHDQQSPALGIPMSCVYTAIPVAAVLMLLELLFQALGYREVARPARVESPD